MKRPLRFAAIVTIAGAATSAARAQNQERSRPREDSLEDFRPDAMPSVQQMWSRWYTLRGLAQTDDGFLWAATDDGLVRFDGVRFDTFRLPARDGRTDLAALGAGKGAVFVALTDGRMARLEGQALALVDRAAPNGLDAAPATVTALAVAGPALVWLGSSAGLFRWDAQPAGGVSHRETAVGGAVRALALAGERLWVAARDGLHRQSDHGFELVQRGWQVALLAAEPAGALWALVTGPEAGLYRLAENGASQRFDVPETEEGRPPNRMTADAEGTLWLASSRALFRLRGGQLQRRPLAFGTRALLADREGSVWAGTYIGALARIALPWTRILGEREGAGASTALSVLETRDGRVWASLDDELVQVSGSRVERLGRQALGGHDCLRSLAEGEGAIWIASCRGLVLRLAVADGRVTAFGEREGLPRDRIDGLVVDRDGVIWVSPGPAGLLRLRDGRFVPEARFSGTQIRTLVASRQGGLWLGAPREGLILFRDGQAQRFGAEAGLAHPYINALFERADGSLWVGSRGGGLQLFVNARFRTVGARGFPVENINGLVEDGRGDLWVTSDAGLYRVPRGGLDEGLRGNALEPRAVRYGAEDGLASERFSDGFSPPAVRARDGRLFFPTALGLAVVRAPESAPAPEPPTIVIDEVRVGGVPHSVSAASPMRLPAHAGETVIRFTAPSFVAPHRLRFQHRLDGRDSGWMASEEREARYAGLAPGRYAFHVRSFRDDSDAAVTEAVLTLEVSRPLRAWLTPIFALLGAGALAFGIQRYRVAQVRRRFASVLGERNRIARDLHDTIAQGFAGITYQVDRLDRAVGDAKPEVREAVERLRTLVRASRLEARQAVWDLRAEAEDMRRLPERLSEMTQQARLASAASVDLAVDGEARPLPAAVEREVVRVAQEAITNALVHGRAQRVDVALAFQSKAVRMEVRDDGTGFDAKGGDDGGGGAPAAARHLGLAGMKERAERIGARLQISSAPGQGTRITLEVDA